jgi:hypothetical protein
MGKIIDSIIYTTQPRLKPYFMIGNRHEGCGHKHRTPKAARACFKRVIPEGAANVERYRIYRITTRPQVTALEYL